MRRATLYSLVLLLGVSGAFAPASPPDAARPGGISTSAQIDGAEGGTVELGRFRVDVPPGAYSGKATITLQLSSRGAKVCALEIRPAAANRFRTPVILSARVADAKPEDQLRLSILRYDEERQRWEGVSGSTLDPVRQEVRAPLEHFSIYGLGDPLLGRSGW